MSVRSKDEILSLVKTRFADDTSDETISFIEDLTDSMTELETRATDTTNWKQKYEDNDKEWRNKYKARFFGEQQKEDEEEYEETETPTIKTFEDLFTVKEN